MHTMPDLDVFYKHGLKPVTGGEYFTPPPDLDSLIQSCCSFRRSLQILARLTCVCYAGKTMKSTLERLGAIRTGDIGKSNFVKPLGIYYELDGNERKW